MMLISMYYIPVGSGNGGGAHYVGEAEQQDGCSTMAPDARMSYANAAFVVARTAAGAGLQSFLRRYESGSTFTVEFPDGSTGNYNVFGPTMSEALSFEISCS